MKQLNYLRIALFILFYLICSQVFAQDNTIQRNKIFNANPNPNGEPWIVGGLPPLTPKLLLELKSIPELDLSHRTVQLPYKINNAEQKYFRTIFNQSGSSCSQAAGVSYNFSYEINFERGTSAEGDDNLFPSHYTWNFLNGGGDGGSSYITGYAIIKENGCPTIKTWGGIAGSNTKWMNDYSKYYSGMQYRIKYYKQINVSKPKGLETLKQWMFDHGDGSSVGGLANFGVEFSGATMKTLPSGTEEAGKKVVTAWGEGGGHSMTFVGYNDSIRYDFNNDGKYTNDIDINSDGIVNMKDWEIGGLLFANSHGTNYGNKGFAYMMYKLCAEDKANGGIYGGGVSVFRATLDYKTPLAFKINIKHNSRSNIRISTGISNKLDAEKPENEYQYPLFNYQAGEHPMQGKDGSESIEIGLDVSRLRNFIDKQKAKYFLIIDSRGGSGEVSNLSLMDYRDANVVETVSDQTNIAIKKGRTLVSLVYESKTKPLLIDTKKLAVAKVNEPYKHTFKAIGGNPPYTWSVMKTTFNEKTISADFPAITSEITPSDTDDAVAEQSLAFSFPFYGEKYDKIYICTDGHILFNSNFERVRSRESLKKSKSIAAFGADLLYRSGDKIYFTSDKKSATIRWKTKHMYSEDGGIKVNLDFAAKLYPNGKIEYFYAKDFTDDISQMVIGVSDGLGSYHIVDVANTTEIPDDHVVKLTPEGFPKGMKLSSKGIFEGTPKEDNKSWKLMFRLCDADSICKTKMITFSTNENTAINLEKGSIYSLNFNYVRQIGSNYIVSFQLPSKGYLNLEMFNVSGKKVKSFKKYFQKPGNHSVIYSKNNISTGMYIFKLNFNNKQKIKKTLIFK